LTAALVAARRWQRSLSPELALLLCQLLLDGLQLSGVVDALALEPRDDLLISEPAAMRLVVSLRLRHQILLCSRQLGLRRLVARELLQLQRLELVGQLLRLPALARIGVVQLIVPLPQVDDLSVKALQLRLRLLFALRRERVAQPRR